MAAAYAFETTLQSLHLLPADVGVVDAAPNEETPLYFTFGDLCENPKQPAMQCAPISPEYDYSTKAFPPFCTKEC